MFSRLIYFLILHSIREVFSDATCPTGTIAGVDSTKCYKYYPMPTSFYAAEEKCASISGHLASSTSGFENYMLSG